MEITLCLAVRDNGEAWGVCVCAFFSMLQKTELRLLESLQKGGGGISTQHEAGRKGWHLELSNSEISCCRW